jgi:hypothetical protein
MARLNQKEEELLLEVTNHLLKCVRYMSECYTLELDDLEKMDMLADAFLELVKTIIMITKYQNKKNLI